MSNSQSDCPFNLELTSSGFKDCLQEAFPYSTLREIVSFYDYLRSGKKFSWLDNVIDIQSPTDFCYYGADEDVNEEAWFPKPRLDRKSVPRNLFCHDYKGGYLEDRFLNGSDKNDYYNFINWACVDIFVYFSHHFVTVPPPMWVNAAHRHGVPILGTIITESNKGHAICEQILASDEKALWVAKTLALIADAHKFDGYLLNIENSIAVELMPRLMIFIKSLKQNLSKYKKTKTYVIWYDSVTVYGELRWQNELNYNNKPFFDITDGIFLNYTWKELNLDYSKKMAAERIHDVFVGVDVFGRNMLGGGGYNTKEALRIVREKNLSAAIFAFGWTHEKIPGNFLVNDEIFWMYISPYLYSHGTKQFPFKCNFSRGCGIKYYKNGVVVNDKPWFNISKQSYQYSQLKCKTKANIKTHEEIVSTINEYIIVLNARTEKKPELELAKKERLVALNSQLEDLYSRLNSSLVEYTFSDAYSGGGCIKINPSFEEGMRHVTLFDADIDIKNDWFVKTVMKAEKGGLLPDIELYPIVYLIVLSKEDKVIKIELRVGEIETSEAGWVTRKFILTQKGRIIEIGLIINPTHLPVLLGQIVINDHKL